MKIIEVSEGFMGSTESIKAFFDQLDWEKEQKLENWAEFWYRIKWDSFWERYPNGCTWDMVQWGDYWYVDETSDSPPPKSKGEHIEDLIRTLNL